MFTAIFLFGFQSLLARGPIQIIASEEVFVKKLDPKDVKIGDIGVDAHVVGSPMARCDIKCNPPNFNLEVIFGRIINVQPGKRIFSHKKALIYECYLFTLTKKVEPPSERWHLEKNVLAAVREIYLKGPKSNLNIKKIACANDFLDGLDLKRFDAIIRL